VVWHIFSPLGGTKNILQVGQVFFFFLLFQDFSNVQNNLLNHGKSITAFSIVNEDGLNLCHLFVINFEF